MKKIYRTPWLMVQAVATELPLATSIDVHDKQDDPVVDDPNDVLSRQHRIDVLEDDEEEAED